jgi:hypothetical protein
MVGIKPNDVKDRFNKEPNHLAVLIRRYAELKWLFHQLFLIWETKAFP